MGKLLERFAGVGDVQVIEDLAVVALGCVAVASAVSEDLVPLAKTVHSLFFSEQTGANTTSLIARMAGRAVIERINLLFPRDVGGLLLESRPPYKPRPLPPIDLQEIADGEHTVVGGNLDFDRYVADRGLRHFFSEVRTEPKLPNRTQLDFRVQAAVLRGDLVAPKSVGLMCKKNDERRRELEKRRLAVDSEAAQLMAELMRLQNQGSKEEADGQDTSPLDEMTDDGWDSRKTLQDHLKSPSDWRHSEAFSQLLRHYQAGTASNLTAEDLRNGLIASIVKAYGWSHERFRCYNWNKEPELVDDAICQRFRAGTHGHRSKICTFQEKYLWTAIHELAGSLADHLPIWDESDRQWRPVRALEELGIELPDSTDEEKIASSGSPWSVRGMQVSQEVLGQDLITRSQELLKNGPLPDPAELVSQSIEGWFEGCLLALWSLREMEYGCIDNLLELQAFDCNTPALEVLLRDSKFVDLDFHDHCAVPGQTVYCSPAIALWAPWVDWEGLETGYISFRDKGHFRVKLRCLAGQITVPRSGDSPEHQIWLPSPALRGKLKPVNTRIARNLRQYLDPDGKTVAIYRQSEDDKLKYLASDFKMLKSKGASGRNIVWSIRLWREVSPALRMRNGEHKKPKGLRYVTRTVQWIVVWDCQKAEFSTHLVSDQLRK